jgi:hypothetical protein
MYFSTKSMSLIFKSLVMFVRTTNNKPPPAILVSSNAWLHCDSTDILDRINCRQWRIGACGLQCTQALYRLCKDGILALARVLKVQLKLLLENGTNVRHLYRDCFPIVCCLLDRVDVRLVTHPGRYKNTQSPFLLLLLLLLLLLCLPRRLYGKAQLRLWSSFRSGCLFRSRNDYCKSIAVVLIKTIHRGLVHPLIQL